MQFLSKKLLVVSLWMILFWSNAAPVWAQTSESTGKQQSPLQVVMTIALCAVLMKILSYFHIP
ncbi:MAG TPA: hypothetical protein V6C65_01970 [Allocoleopsis sp.]